MPCRPEGDGTNLLLCKERVFSALNFEGEDSIFLRPLGIDAPNDTASLSEDWNLQ